MLPSEHPSAPPATSTELLEGLRDPANRTVWSQYVARYRPLLERTAERAGLAPVDAEEVAQTTLVEFSAAYARGEYRRERGRLRSWLFGILRNRLRERGREGGRERGRFASDAGDRLAAEPAPDTLEEIWDEEWRRAVIRRCTEVVRGEVHPRTFEAFRRYVLEGETVESIAADLALSPEGVYDAKRRVLRRLRELRPVLEESW